MNLFILAMLMLTCLVGLALLVGPAIVSFASRALMMLTERGDSHD